MASLLGSLTMLAALAPASPAIQDALKVKALAEAKVKLAREILTQYREYLVAPPGERGIPAPLVVAEEIQAWSRKLADARLEAAEDRAQRLVILGEEVGSAREFEKLVKELVGGGATGLDKVSAKKAEFARIEAEIRLAHEQAAR